MTRKEEWADAYGDFGQQPQVQLMQLPLEILDAWLGTAGEQQPFKLYSEEKLSKLAESIRQHGVIEPICVRPKADSRFEIIAGHNRVAAAKLAGLRTVPANVQRLDDVQAALMLVDSNLQHRETLLPSEKAFAYKLRLDCLKRQAGRPSKENASPLATNFQSGRSDVALGEQVGESKDQVRRYIRLTNLVTPLLNMVDEGQIKLRSAVELSYLSEKKQQLLLEIMSQEEKKPNMAQAKEIRKAADGGWLDADELRRILSPEKPPMPKALQIPMDEVVKFFPAGTSPAQMQKILLAALAAYRTEQKEESL